MPEPIDERLEKLRRESEELAISCRKLREEVEAKKHKKKYS